jgi:uncharacterized protein DUF1707
VITFLLVCRLTYRLRDRRERRSDRAGRAHGAAGVDVAPPAEAGPAREVDAGRMRASDAERERTVEALRVHAAAGRLDADELERRVEAAFAATMRADLDALRADLPGLPRSSPPRPRRNGPAATALAAEWAAFAVVAVILLTVWALTGADGFWPAWPLGFWGAALLLKGPVPWAHAGRRVTPGRG